MSVLLYLKDNSFSIYVMMIMIFQMLSLVLGGWMTCKSIINVDWNKPYCINRWINYVLASVGSSSMVLVIFNTTTYPVSIYLIQALVLLLLMLIYRKLGYDSELILNIFRKLVR